MKQLVLVQFPWPWLTALALLIFFGFFITLVIRVNHKSQKQNISEASIIPLKGEVLHHD